MARWQKRTAFSAHNLSPWEVSISGNSPSLCVCAVLSADDYPLLSGPSWSDMVRRYIPSWGEDQVTFFTSAFVSLP